MQITPSRGFTLLFAIAIAFPAAAQVVDLTGTWRGSYSIHTDCEPGKPTDFGGSISASIVQTGSSASGNAVFSDFVFDTRECVPVSRVEAMFPFTGTVTGNQFAGGSVGAPGASAIIGGTASPDAMALRFFAGDASGQLNLTRVDSTRAASDLSGQYSGTLEITEDFSQDCSNYPTPIGQTAPVSATVVHTGNNLTAMLLAGGLEVAERIPACRAPNATCKTCSMRLTPPEQIVAMGHVDGSSFSGSAVSEEGHMSEFQGTASGSTIFVTGRGGTTVTFSLRLSREGQITPGTVGGHYGGRYEATEDYSSACGNLGVITHSGPASITVSQLGSLISGSIVRVGVKEASEPDASGWCRVAETGPDLIRFTGMLAGGAISGTFESDDASGPMTATITGDRFQCEASYGSSRWTAEANLSRGTSPEVLAFKAVPSTVVVGQPVLLVWSTYNASSVTIDHGIGDQLRQGSVTLTPAATMTYTLTATGVEASTTATAAVTVKPAGQRRRVIEH